MALFSSDGIMVAAEPPLVVDLDGTLVRTDLLVESAFAHLGENPLRIVSLLGLLGRGRAALKAGIAAETAIDPAHLPYDPRILAMIDEARAAGRTVHIASASNERYVAAIAEHLGVDAWFASTAGENLAGDTKARRLIATFGVGGFDYVGNDRADLPVWAVCRRAGAVEPSAAVRRALVAIAPEARILAGRGGRMRAWISLIRVHQWAKNALVFVPLITAHRFDAAAVAAAIAAFFAFSFAASAVYIVNDLVDVAADRVHPSKCRRPLAAGTVSIPASLPAAAALLVAAFAAAAATTAPFVFVLVGYLVATTAYTFVLKRKMIVDIIVLAGLYTVRVIGGAAAISVAMSEWLLGFSMFIFTALALIKRYVELAARVDADLPDPTNRNYRKSDLGIVAALAAGAGFNAVTVFALYISSDAVRRLYRHPELLWLICPILMYWLGRAMMMAQRRLMNDDPIVFALRDRNSLLAFGLIGSILLAATRSF